MRNIYFLNKIVGLVALCVVTNLYPCFTQTTNKFDYVWELGHESMSPDDPISLELSFNDGVRNFQSIYRSVGMRTTSATLSSEDGELLLYTNGCEVYNADHNIIENGININPGFVHDNWCGNGYVVPDGAIFVQLSDTLIGLYHLGALLVDDPVDIFADKLYETLIRIDNLNFSVIKKNVVIINDTLSRGGLEVVRDPDDCWWLLAARRADNTYYSVHISSEGVDSITSFTIGTKTNISSDGGGQKCFSPDGTKYARYSPRSNLDLYDFDRSTGLLSDHRRIHVVDTGIFGGLAFSPNSQYLYASNLTELYQVDTESDDSVGAVVLIDTFDGFGNPFPATFYQMQLGPDCKIYMIPNNGIPTMHVIESPDNYGKDCNFRQHGIELPVSNSISLPNFAVARIDGVPPCDPGIVTSTNEITNFYDRSELISIFPNPSSGRLQIENQTGVKCEIRVYNTFGQLVYYNDDLPSGITQTVTLDIIPGIYFHTITSGPELISTGKLIIIN